MPYTNILKQGSEFLHFLNTTTNSHTIFLSKIRQYRHNNISATRYYVTRKNFYCITVTVTIKRLYIMFIV